MYFSLTALGSGGCESSHFRYHSFWDLGEGAGCSKGLVLFKMNDRRQGVVLNHTDTYKTSAWKWHMLYLQIRGQNQWSEKIYFIHNEVTKRERMEGSHVTWETVFLTYKWNTLPHFFTSLEFQINGPYIGGKF